MSEQPKDEVNVDAIIHAHKHGQEEAMQRAWRGLPEEEPGMNALATVMILWYVAGIVLLVLSPFFEWATLFRATCVFVIGFCFLGFYRVMEDSKLGNERFVILCRLLREIRDAVKEGKGDNKDS